MTWQEGGPNWGTEGASTSNVSAQMARHLRATLERGKTIEDIQNCLPDSFQLFTRKGEEGMSFLKEVMDTLRTARKIPNAELEELQQCFKTLAKLMETFGQSNAELANTTFSQNQPNFESTRMILDQIENGFDHKTSNQVRNIAKLMSFILTAFEEEFQRKTTQAKAQRAIEEDFDRGK